MPSSPCHGEHQLHTGAVHGREPELCTRVGSESILLAQNQPGRSLRPRCPGGAQMGVAGLGRDGAGAVLCWELWGRCCGPCAVRLSRDRTGLCWGRRLWGWDSLPGDTAELFSAPCGWVGNGGDMAPAPRRDVGLFPVAVTVSPAVPKGRKRAAANPSSRQPLPGPPGAAWRRGSAGCGDVVAVLVPSAVTTGAGLDRSAGGTEVAVGRRNVPLHIPVSQGPRRLCRP